MVENTPEKEEMVMMEVLKIEDVIWEIAKDSLENEETKEEKVAEDE